MNRLAFALCLLLAGVLIGLAELPYQWLSELGFRLQRLWPLGGDGALDPRLVLAPALATLLFVLLAWGRWRRAAAVASPVYSRCRQPAATPSASAPWPPCRCATSWPACPCWPSPTWPG